MILIKESNNRYSFKLKLKNNILLEGEDYKSSSDIFIELYAIYNALFEDKEKFFRINSKCIYFENGIIEPHCLGAYCTFKKEFFVNSKSALTPNCQMCSDKKEVT